MPEKNPFDDLFEQLSDLLNYVQENSNVPSEEMKIPKDIDERLTSLEKKVKAFNKISKEIVDLSGVSQEELRKRLQGVSDEVPPQGKQLINKSHAVKRQAEILCDHMETLLKNVAQVPEEIRPPDVEERPERNLTDEARAKKRRSKFKRFGSDEKWKPL